jgi:hypothetical protein
MALERLYMGDKLLAYISKFNKLRRKAGWDTDAEGAMRYFHRGLTEGLLYSMLKTVGLQPTILEGWQELAIKHHNAF